MQFCHAHTILVMSENLAKLDLLRRLAQFLKTSLVLLISNCTGYRIITYTSKIIDFSSGWNVRLTRKRQNFEY